MTLSIDEDIPRIDDAQAPRIVAIRTLTGAIGECGIVQGRERCKGSGSLRIRLIVPDR